MAPSTCGTFIPCKLWNLKVEEDPLAEKQKWYCWQGRKYKANWGQVVEFMTVGGRLMYAHATESPSCCDCHVLRQCKLYV